MEPMPNIKNVVPNPNLAVSFFGGSKFVKDEIVGEACSTKSIKKTVTFPQTTMAANAVYRFRGVILKRL